MFQQKFAEIFAELDSIETKLKQGAAGKKEKEKFSERLLTLRRFMDQCIQSWLCFEERVNQLQDTFGLDLPDEIPDMLFKNLGLEELGAAPDKGAEGGMQDLPEEEKEFQDKEGALPPNMNFGKMRKDASISSFKRGLGFYDLYMLEEAIQEFENLVNLEPNFIIGHFLLGHVYSHKEKYDNAEKEFRLVLALTGDPLLKSMVYNALGNIYAVRGKYEQALEEFQLAQENSQEVKEVHFNLAATYYNLGHYNESITFFKNAMEYFPDDWEIHFYLGKAHQYLKEYTKAVPYLETAVHLNPLDSMLNFELGIIYHLLNQREKAISQYIKTLELAKKKKARDSKPCKLN